MWSRVIKNIYVGKVFSPYFLNFQYDLKNKPGTVAEIPSSRKAYKMITNTEGKKSAQFGFVLIVNQIIKETVNLSIAIRNIGLCLKLFSCRD